MEMIRADRRWHEINRSTAMNVRERERKILRGCDVKCTIATRFQAGERAMRDGDMEQNMVDRSDEMSDVGHERTERDWEMVDRRVDGRDGYGR
jgi:hypothetical protein